MTSGICMVRYSPVSTRQTTSSTTRTRITCLQSLHSGKVWLFFFTKLICVTDILLAAYEAKWCKKQSRANEIEEIKPMVEAAAEVA
jgi:hypothetical protein